MIFLISDALMPLSVNIIGAGRLGKTIGRLLVQCHQANILGVCNTSTESAHTAVAFIGEGRPFQEISALPTADITLITTPDDNICDISVMLSKYGNIRPGNVFIHCSGVLTSDLLAPVKAKGGVVASVHPMKSFADPQLSVTNFHGTHCAIEGDPEALQTIEPIFKAIGAVTYPIEQSKKSTYHAAGVFASNYLVTLSQQATHCLVESGVNETAALNIVISLMQGTLTNIERTMSPREALTGPVKRGDVSTIRADLMALSGKQKDLYSILGDATLELTAHNDETLSRIKESLSFLTWSL